MERIKRNHITTLFDDVVSYFKAWLIPLLFLIFSKPGTDSNGFITRFIGTAQIKYLILITVALLMFGFALLKWFRKSYSVKDGFIVMNEGIFIRKRREIPVNKVQTINLSQNVLQKIFHTAALKIDTGNATSKDAEIFIVVRRADADEVKESILGGNLKNKEQEFGMSSEAARNSGLVGVAPLNEIPKKDSYSEAGAPITAAYTVTPAELAIAGLTSNSLFAGIAFLASAYAFLDDFADFLGNTLTGWFLPYVEGYDLRTMRINEIITFVLVIFVLYFILSSIVAIIGSIIKYHNFTATRQGGKLMITYGLLNTKSYIIPVDKIKVVYIRQSFLRQFFGIVSLHVESVGYGNEKGESSVIYPVSVRSKGMAILRSLLPEFAFDRQLVKVPVRSLRRFILSPLYFPLVLCILATLLFKSYGYLSFILVPFLLLKGILEYRNSAAGKDDRLICIRSRAFTRTTALLRLDGIQSATHSSNWFQRRSRLFNYTLSIQSNNFGTAVTVKNLDESMREEFMGITWTKSC